MQKMTLNEVLRKKSLIEKGFDIQDGWTVEVKETAKGLVFKQLANFTAWPVKEIEYDDGQQTKRFVEIEGTLANGRALPAVRVSHEEFLGILPRVLSKHWGLDIIIKPRAKESLREAIQALGYIRKHETIYTYTGWRQINGQWVFLHVGGAVGAENIRVNIGEGGENLQRYALPSDISDQKTVANHAFSILELATPDISYPLFAATFMAPLTDILKPVSLGADFVLFLISRTQSGKSTLAALYQSFFGEFDKNHFPANYRMTASSLERTTYLLKDVLMVVDDYYPAQAASEKTHLKQLAQLLARLYGDGAGRARMDGSGKLQQTYEPRGLAISTGEERPEIGESGQARFVFLDVNRDKVRYEDAEDYAINKKHYLAQFMVMYLTWVAANRERIPAIFSETYNKARELLHNAAYTGRINESMAKLCGALEVVLTFALEEGFINEIEYTKHGEKAFAGFQFVLDENVKNLVAEKPSQKFLDIVAELIQSKEAAVCLSSAKTKPDNYIGCYDEQYVYLSADACYQAVLKYCKERKLPFNMSMYKVGVHLKNDRIIEISENKKKNTIEKRVGWTTQKDSVYKMLKSHIGLE